MMKFNFKNQAGFTLLEALVAVSILMVAVSAPITIAQKGLSSAVYSKDQMIASYLAQDAIEYIKNKRDQVAINNPSFDWENLSILTSCITNLDGCEIDTIKNSANPSDDINPYSPTGPTPLKKDSNGFYQYTSGQETKFNRQIKIEMIPSVKNPVTNNPDEALVTVTVRWGADENKVVVKTLIFNY